MNEHIFIKKLEQTIILLHGTGGDERDLIPIANHLNSNASILGIRGNVVENGMNRYFKRYGMGKYDLKSFDLETNNLHKAIMYYAGKYKIDLNKAIIIGFSNGANIAQGLIKKYPKLVNKYALLSPDYINPEQEIENLDNLNIFIATAINDPYANYDNVIKMTEDLKIVVPKFK